MHSQHVLRKPIFGLLNKPNLLPVISRDHAHKKESLALSKERNQPALEASGDLVGLLRNKQNLLKNTAENISPFAENITLLDSPIFSMPNPYDFVTVRPSEKNFKLSGWQEVLGNVTQQLIAGEDNAAPESDRSKVGNTDTSPAAPVKKKKHG